MPLPTPGPMLSVQDAGSVGRESACSLRRCRRQGFDPGRGKSSEEEVATHSSVLAGSFQGQRRLEGCGPWGLRETWLSTRDTQDAPETSVAPFCQSGSVADNSSSTCPLIYEMTLGLRMGSPSPRDTCPPVRSVGSLSSGATDFNARHPFSWGQASPVMQGVCVCVWLNINLSLKPYIFAQSNPGALHTQTSIQGFTATREPGSPDSGSQVA